MQRDDDQDLETAKIRRDRERIARQLLAERERLRIALASIGDGVISVDADGRVVFLNGVAEALTGWSQADAAGRPMSDVFVVVHERTREPVENPALQALREGRVVALANHTVLVARDGTERPIDDSAAPMRDEGAESLGAVLVFRDVTQRRKTEQIRARLAAIVESSDDAIVGKTLEGIVVSWNAAATLLFGYTSDEMVGASITLLIPEERLMEEESILGRIRRGERVESFETVRRRKDGSHVDISLTVSPIRSSDGAIIGASKIARDIGAKKRAEEVLRQSEGRHRFLGELGAATQALSDPAELMSTSARLLAEHLDLDRCAYAEVEDESVFVITGDHTRGVESIVGRWPVAAFGADCARAMQANTPFVVDDVDADPRAGVDLDAYRRAAIRAVVCVPLHKDGRFTAAIAAHQATPRRWTAAEIALIRTVGERSWESIERARVARGLTETADRLELAFRAARLGEWSWDMTTGTVVISARAAEIFGLDAAGAITPATLLERLVPEDRERFRAELERAFAARAAYDLEVRVVRPEGQEVWVSAQGHAGARKDAAVLGVVQDITDRVLLRRELERRADQLAEADRKKDDFIALLAHELRNPLAPVRTGLQVMRLAAADARAVADARDMMDRQLSHMVRLIDDLLDVSRMNRNKLHLQRAHVTLAEVVRHALEASRPLMEAAEHTLEVSLPDAPVVLDADLTRLAQVFGNLLTNSTKYTERGGRITLRAEVVGDEVHVAVRDNGIGIPAEALPLVFEMFAQVDRSVERTTGGLGIGLALVRGLVETHGGSVTVESAGAGRGSTFTVRLPIVAAAAHPSSPPAEPIAPAPRRRRVLVADDNPDGAESLAALLELLGNEVHVASDGVEAVEIAERVRPHLVLMDVGMPRMSGLDATRELRLQPWGRAIRIIALTGWGQSGDRARTREAGCDGHLVKPVGLPDLEAVLAQLSSDTD